MGAGHIRSLGIAYFRERVQAVCYAKSAEKSLKKALVGYGKNLFAGVIVLGIFHCCVGHYLKHAVQLLYKFHVNAVVHIGHYHVCLADTAHVVNFKNQIVVTDSASDEPHIVHHVFSETILGSAETLFLVRFLHRAARITPAVDDDKVIEPLTHKKGQTRIKLGQGLLVTVVSLVCGSAFLLSLDKGRVQKRQSLFYELLTGLNVFKGGRRHAHHVGHDVLRLLTVGEAVDKKHGDGPAAHHHFSFQHVEAFPHGQLFFKNFHI